MDNEINHCKENFVYEMPREKLIRNGAVYLSDQELIALLLSTGTKGKGVLDLSFEIFKKFGNFMRLSRSTVNEISKMTGIGKTKACRLLAACELGLRIKYQTLKSEPIICSKNVFDRCHRFALLERETFHAISLNVKNRVVGEWKISEGSLHECILSPRDVFSFLMKEGVFQVIFIHNHPSGDPTPSNEDLEFTKRLIKSGSILGINVLDHIIIGGDTYVSLKDEGKM